jgi:hypothetical protein
MMMRRRRRRTTIMMILVYAFLETLIFVQTDRQTDRQAGR